MPIMPQKHDIAAVAVLQQHPARQAPRDSEGERRDMSENYYEDTPTSRLFPCIEAKILDFLILNEQLDRTLPDMAKQLGLSEAAINPALKRMIEDEIVEQTAKGYKFARRKNERSQRLYEYFEATVTDNLNKWQAEFERDPIGYWHKQFPEFFEKADKAARIDVVKYGSGEKIICYDENNKELTYLTADEKTISQIRSAIKQKSKE